MSTLFRTRLNCAKCRSVCYNGSGPNQAHPQRDTHGVYKGVLCSHMVTLYTPCVNNIKCGSSSHRTHYSCKSCGNSCYGGPGPNRSYIDTHRGNNHHCYDCVKCGVCGRDKGVIGKGCCTGCLVAMRLI